MEYITTLEQELGMIAEKRMLPLQEGDVPETSADISKAKEMLDYSPETSIKEGISAFVKWYTDFYSTNNS